MRCVAKALMMRVVCAWSESTGTTSRTRAGGIRPFYEMNLMANTTKNNAQEGVHAYDGGNSPKAC